MINKLKSLYKKYKSYKQVYKDDLKDTLKINKYAKKMFKNKNNLITRKCPLCKCKEFRFVYNAPVLRFVKCTNCGLTYAKQILNPIKEKEFYVDNPYYNKNWEKKYKTLKEIKNETKNT